ncbi:hypothetical protein BLNAU_23265 [Blattamonas nauphoetae]|uniref:Uncharacterized protein n=1 Tax=Blattamonas nauphoetae TaxID=2049346 RepID=A0ABQ9WQN6_9EUKA|nr:hypothetical protein BLNAU_23265 [Blattamonas nauphoetae]
MDDLASSKLIVVLPSTLSSALVNIIPSSENARSPRDPPHMTAEGSRFRVHPNSHLQTQFILTGTAAITTCTSVNVISRPDASIVLGNEDTTSSIAVRFLLAVILLVRKFLNTQRITHVVICGTGTTSDPSTFLASPAKHVSRVCSFLDKALDGDGVILVHSPQGHNRAMLILVSGACDGSDVAEPADSDEAIVRFGVEEASWSD